MTRQIKIPLPRVRTSTSHRRRLLTGATALAVGAVGVGAATIGDQRAEAARQETLTSVQPVVAIGDPRIAHPKRTWTPKPQQTTASSTPSTSTTPSSTSTSTTRPPSSSTTTSSTPSSTTTTASSTAYPAAGNTGVPAGVTLKPSGGMTVSTAGAVIDGYNITGTLTINASNVVVKRSKISSSSYNVIKVSDSATGVRIEDVEINGNKAAEGSNGIYGPATVLRADIQGVENGLQPETGSVIQDSWIHDLGAAGRPHIDGIQIDGARSNITVRHNTVDLRGWTQTAAVMIDNYFGPANNIVVDNNRLLGGGYTVYSDGRFDGGAITNVKYTNNRIGYGQWGYALIANNNVTWSGNVDDATGRTATP